MGFGGVVEPLFETLTQPAADASTFPHDGPLPEQDSLSIGIVDRGFVLIVLSYACPRTKPFTSRKLNGSLLSFSARNGQSASGPKFAGGTTPAIAKNFSKAYRPLHTGRPLISSKESLPIDAAS